MRSAFLLSPRPDLIQLIADLLVPEGGVFAPDGGGMVQLSDPRGRLITFFGTLPSDPAWNDVDALVYDPQGGLPDVSDLSGITVECRWVDLFVEVVGGLADRLPNPLWVLDDNDVLWPADRIDATRLRL